MWFEVERTAQVKFREWIEADDATEAVEDMDDMLPDEGDVKVREVAAPSHLTYKTVPRILQGTIDYLEDAEILQESREAPDASDTAFELKGDR